MPRLSASVAAPVPAAIAARAARGAAALDAYDPGWARRLRGKRISLDECPGCVLGRLYGSYAQGRDILDPLRRVGWAAHHGFYANVPSHYPLLRRAWADEIRARLRKDSR